MFKQFLWKEIRLFILEVWVLSLCCRQEKSAAGLDHIVGAMNIFCNKFAINCRMRICKLGEEILPTVLYIWTQYRPKDSLKESIIELFRLQVHIHHPKGAKTQGKGTAKVICFFWSFFYHCMWLFELCQLAAFWFWVLEALMGVVFTCQ